MTQTMTHTGTVSLAKAAASATAQQSSRFQQYLQLSKLRLNAMVLITTAVGFLVAMPGAISYVRLVWTLLGTALAAVGASALNQVVEARRDAMMERTRHRPLPSGQMTRSHALVFAFLTTFAGILILNELVNPLTAFLGLLNVVIYIGFYTPLKTRTSLNTLVGALCGALPPMMGYAAAVDSLGTPAWLLGAILFLWQIPHFLALAWMYRAEYARAGYRMLPVVDAAGNLTCLLMVLYTLALLPLALLLTFLNVAGWAFAAASLPLGLMFFTLAVYFARTRTRANARRVFLASVTYLPILLLLLVLDLRP